MSIRGQSAEASQEIYKVQTRIKTLAAALMPTVLSAGVSWFAVDPMSETRFLPHAAPEGGEKGGTVRMIAAKDEYEPASFVLTADEDLGKVAVTIGELKTDDGKVFPKEKLDLRMVKVWYQCGTAWWSYFGDPAHQKLCPELLLHDEDLVKVDEKKEANYARITEKDGKVWFRWLNPPGAVDGRIEDAGYTGYPGFNSDSFLSMAPNFRDADVFTGVTLKKGVYKQLWLTANVGKGVAAGVYRGVIRVRAEERTASVRQQAIPFVLRVLDFELPEPCTYLDCNRRFFTRFRPYLSLHHIMGVNGNDRALAGKQMVAILKNFAEHGLKLPSYLDRFSHFEWGREAGLDFTHPLYEAGDMTFTDKAAMRHHARHLKADITKEIGWHNPLLGWGDEYGLKTLLGIRDMVKIYEDEGFRFLCNSQAGYEAGSYMIDCWRPPYAPDRASFEKAFKVSRLEEVELGWYAVQHVGVENPAFCRRQYGFGPYRAGFTFDGNYAHHIQGWNDRTGDLFRPMMLIYGVNNGCLDTIAWEGFREGVDDIRYATLLQRLAHKLVRSECTEARYAAKKALGLLANADKDDMDLTTFRLEMIRHILKLRTF